MANLNSCAAGHRWSVDPAETLPPGAATDVCPQCGGAAVRTMLHGEAVERSGVFSAYSTPRSEGIQVPGYEILGLLGRGGMGVVYKARQTRLERLVALKMILAGSHAGSEELDRFRLEAQAVARLQHPNIVQIYEVGEYEGRPFFSLEFVEGGSLAHQLAASPLNSGDAAHLVEQLARAMHYAHQQGIVHRDLKPANVLMSAELGVRNAESPSSLRTPRSALRTPKVADFGLAKLLDIDSGQTATGQIIGSACYMSPEQAAGRVKQIGPAADVYSLGAILYECLTGRPPFRAASFAETVQQVLSEETVAPRSLQPNVPRDLETICLKCLAKEPHKRYASAADLADELRRFQSGEPITARPTPMWERGLKWARRHPSVTVMAAVAAAVILGSLAIVTRQLQETKQALANTQLAEQEANHRKIQAEQAREAEAREKREAQIARDRADDARRAETAAKNQARHDLYFSNLALADRQWEAANPGGAERLLNECPPQYRDWEWRHQKWRLSESLVTLLGHYAPVVSVAFTGPQQVVTVGVDDRIKVWNTATRQVVSELEHDYPANAWELSPDGRLAALACKDKLVRIFDTLGGKELATLAGHEQPPTCLAFAPDGKRLVSAGKDQTVRTWDLETDQAIDVFRDPAITISALAWSKDDLLALAAQKLPDVTGRVYLWDAASGEEIGSLAMRTTRISSVCFSPDGTRLAAACPDRVVRVWQPREGKLLLELRGHLGEVSRVMFSPDGASLATGSNDQTVRTWSVKDGSEIAVLRGHRGWVRGLGFSPDGRSLVAGGLDRTARIWPVARDNQHQTMTDMYGYGLAVSRDSNLVAGIDKQSRCNVYDRAADKFAIFGEHEQFVSNVALSGDGKRMATASRDKTIRIFDLERHELIRELKGHAGQPWALEFCADGRHLAASCVSVGTSENAGELVVWDHVAPQRVKALSFPNDIYSIAYRPDGRRLALAYKNVVEVYDTSDWTRKTVCEGHQRTAWCVAYSSDGSRLASGGNDITRGEIKLWDPETGRELMSLYGHAGSVLSLAFSPDGRRLASSAVDATVRLWDVETGRETMTLLGHKDKVLNVAFAPDGQNLYSASTDGTIRIWPAPETRELLVLGPHTLAANRVVFSGEDRQLLVGDQSGRIRVWDAESGRELHHLSGHASGVASMCNSPDGKLLASGDVDHVIRLWDPQARVSLHELKGHTDQILSLAFSPDGARLYSGSSDKTIAVWDTPTGSPLSSWPSGQHRICGLAITPDGARLYSISHDGSVKLWDLAEETEVLSFKAHQGGATSMALTPNGERLVTAGGADYLIHIWDADGNRLHDLAGHSNRVEYLAVSPDGRLLASASYDRTVRVWNVTDGQPIHVFKGHLHHVIGLAFSSDSQRLASASHDETVRVWNVAE